MSKIEIFNGAKNKKNPLNLLFNHGASGMSKKKKGKKKNPTHRSSHPFHHTKKKGKKRNPSLAMRERSGGTIEFLGAALVTAIVPGILIEQFAPQYNSGLWGYLAEGAGGWFLSYMGGRFFGRRTFDGGMAGTVAALAIRASQDLRATPIKAATANARNQIAAASSQGVSGVGRMGTTVQWPFPQPQIYAQVPGSQPALPPPQPQGGMSGMGRRVVPGQRVYPVR